MKTDYSVPILNDCGGDVNRKWYIYYKVFDPIKNKVVVIRDYAGLHKEKDAKKRRNIALYKLKEIHDKLVKGWRPFAVSSVESELLYHFESRYRKKVLANNSFEAIVSEYLKNAKITEKSKPEIKSKSRGFNSFLVSLKKDADQMALIDNATMLRFFDFLANDKKLCAVTYNKYKQCLSNIWDFAVKQTYCAVNIVTNIPECSRIVDQAAYPITDSDRKLLMERIKDDPQLELACNLELLCFLRPQFELRLLKIGMIDFDKSVIHVPPDLAKNTNPNRKRGKMPTIPRQLLRYMIEVHHLDRYPKDYYVFGKNRQPCIEPIGKNNIPTRFRKIREELGLPKCYKLYSFKHTGVGKMLDLNFHQNEIMKQAGWTTGYMIDVYTKHKERQRNDNIMNNFVF